MLPYLVHPNLPCFAAGVAKQRQRQDGRKEKQVRRLCVSVSASHPCFASPLKEKQSGRGRSTTIFLILYLFLIKRTLLYKNNKKSKDQLTLPTLPLQPSTLTLRPGGCRGRQVRYRDRRRVRSDRIAK